MKLPLLPILYELPLKLAADGGWRERKYWPIINPNLGRSVDEGFLERTVQKAEAEGSAQLALIASQHLNVQIGQGLTTDGWPGAEDWEACADPALTLDDLLARSEVVTVGVDFGGKDDLFSLCVLGREPGAGILNRRRWLAWGHSWCHQIAIERRKAEASHYDDFVKAGELTVVERLGQDIDEAVAIVRRVYDMGLLAGVGLDPNRVGPLLGALEAAGVAAKEGDDAFISAVTQGRAQGGAAISAERKFN